MPFNKPKAIVHLMRDGLQIYEAGIDEHTFLYPEGSVRNLEVVDGQQLVHELTKYLGISGNPATRYLLLLSEEVVFQKITVAKKQEEKERRIQLFLDEVPIPPEKLVHKTHEVPKGTLITAVNSELVQQIIKSFSQMEWKLHSVVPETIYGNGELDQNKISTILKNPKMAKKEGISIASEEDSSKSNPKKLLFIIFAIFLAAAVAIGGKLVYQFVFAELYAPKADVVTSEITPAVDFTTGLDETEETNESTAEAELTKGNLVITVLNGTGVHGLAGQIEASINALGYENTSIGNAESIGNINTTLEYSENTPQNYVDEIVVLLKESFENVEVKISLSDVDTYKVTVTTGNLLTGE